MTNAVKLRPMVRKALKSHWKLNRFVNGAQVLNLSNKDKKQLRWYLLNQND